MWLAGWCVRGETPDTDKLFPVFGFGGKLGPDQPANHCFPVNFDENHPEVQGMDGVLQVTTHYQWRKSHLRFSYL